MTDLRSAGQIENDKERLKQIVDGKDLPGQYQVSWFTSLVKANLEQSRINRTLFWSFGWFFGIGTAQ